MVGRPRVRPPRRKRQPGIADEATAGVVQIPHSPGWELIHAPSAPDFLRTHLQDCLLPPSTGYRLNFLLGRGGDGVEYVDGQSKGSTFVFQRYEDNEGGLAPLVRPRLVGEIEQERTGSVFR
jgi:hypothetical protein